MSEIKPTNPKDAIGATKVPMGLVPDSAIVEASMAFLEGACKYGRYNWRGADVRASIYHDALRRHLSLWWNGEDIDTETGIPHLGSIIACAAILIDSRAFGSLNDDRPPSANMRALLEARKDITMPRVKELFAGHDPKQWTIADVLPPRPILSKDKL